ncbi:hypothetical protein HDU91_001558 [Kappamyces sp. JEL0680]|nr:hypothetical protein HDU91_001558 [Kappamyces sp. JEL0680]
MLKNGRLRWLSKGNRLGSSQGHSRNLGLTTTDHADSTLASARLLARGFADDVEFIPQFAHSLSPSSRYPLSWIGKGMDRPTIDSASLDQPKTALAAMKLAAREHDRLQKEHADNLADKTLHSQANQSLDELVDKLSRTLPSTKDFITAFHPFAIDKVQVMAHLLDERIAIVQRDCAWNDSLLVLLYNLKIGSCVLPPPPPVARSSRFLVSSQMVLSNPAFSCLGLALHSMAHSKVRDSA